MCQLTFIDLDSAEYNKFYALIQEYLNSSKDNQDGFGYFNGKHIYRSDSSPFFMSNLGEFIKFIGRSPTICHVRKATHTNGVKEISVKNSHPFYTKDLVLAHNGSLECSLEDTSDLNGIDSENFLIVLQKNYETSGYKDFPKVLKDTYENSFTGKFAFLIYNKVESNYYIVRGETADLHVMKIYLSNGDFLGTIVNTNKDDLDMGSQCFFNWLQLFKNKTIDFEKSKIEPLAKNTIYKFNSETRELEEVGAIVEAKKVYVTQPIKRESAVIVGTETTGGMGNIENSAKILHDFIYKYGIDLKYLDHLFSFLIGVPLLFANKTDVTIFIEEIIPQIEYNILNPHVVRDWRQAVNQNKPLDLIRFHVANKIEFPYMLTSDISSIRKLKRGNDDSIVHPYNPIQ